LLLPGVPGEELFCGGGGAFVFAPEEVDLADLGQFVAFPPGGFAVGVDDFDVPLLGRGFFVEF